MIVTEQDSEHGIVIHRASGDVHLWEIALALTQWRRSDEFAPSVPMLWDFSGADRIMISILDLGPAGIKDDQRYWPSTRMAWVTSTYAAAATVEMMLETLDWRGNSRVFETVGDARAWLAAATPEG